MINLIEIRNQQGNLLTLLVDDPSTGYEVRDIDGLDPVDAEIVSSNFADQDGEQFQTSRRGKRNIVMKLGYAPDYSSMSVRSLRSALYKFFMPKYEVNLRFISDDLPAVEIKGTVETMRSPLFVADPEATISILCMQPIDFTELTTVTVEGFTTATLAPTDIEYTGSSNTGFVFKLLVDREIDSFTIYNSGENQIISQLDFRISSPLVAGDILEISTVSGNKYATLTHTEDEVITVSSVLYAVNPNSSWLNLMPGTNHIRVSAEGAPIPYTIQYTNKHGGL